jgi:hypothetical protein
VGDDLGVDRVLAHHRVVGDAWRRWGTVLPLAFNTIINGEQASARRALVDWLDVRYQYLGEKLEALVGKEEYGVQVFWDPEGAACRIGGDKREVQRPREEIASKPRGVAYMYRQRLKMMIKREMEARASQESEALYGRIALHVDQLRVDKAGGNSADGRTMLLNLSCLVSREKLDGLRDELHRIGAQGEYGVRMAGPLPHYSFC